MHHSEEIFTGRVNQVETFSQNIFVRKGNPKTNEQLFLVRYHKMYLKNWQLNSSIAFLAVFLVTVDCCDVFSRFRLKRCKVIFKMDLLSKVHGS